MHFILAVLCLILFVACRPTEQTSPPVTETPISPTLNGTVNILTPAEGTLIYSEVLRISGTAQDLPDDQFELALVGPDDTDIATSIVHVRDESWAVELPHTYHDVPIEVIMTARSPDPAVSGEYNLVTVALSGLDYRPAGTFATITFPAEGSTIGGEQFQVGGMVSGLADQQFMVNLMSAENTLLDSQIITIDHPFPIDDIPWSGELSTAEYIGDATIQVLEEGSSLEVITSVEITIMDAAG